MIVHITRAAETKANSFGDLIAGVRAGGVTIETAHRNEPERVACRTVVQLDGDMLVYVDPGIESDSPEWLMHEKEARIRIRRMARAVRQLTNGIHLCIAMGTMGTVYVGGHVSGLDIGASVEIWGSIVVSLALQLGLTRLFPKVAPQLAGWLLGETSRRWKRLAGFEHREEFQRRTRVQQ